jgi:glycosyltransferase involved in cell wall biosynthesis
MKTFPLVSIIMPTYNRANTIERAISSVLNQTYRKLELVIIDDGSNDDTIEILTKYHDHRIRLIMHSFNRGVTAAKNTGLNHIKGEWFTMLDSDDEMLLDAIETMINIPLNFDGSISAVTCNCIDSISGNITGKGIDKDQYVDVETMMTLFKGEFWGLTKSNLIGNDRFNENLSGWESVLWYKIDDRANRYYIHKALRIYHTEGNDRVSNAIYNFDKDVKFYINLIIESHYLRKLKKYKFRDYYNICRNGIIVMCASKNVSIASEYFALIKMEDNSMIKRIILYLFCNYQISYLYIRLKTIKSRIKRDIFSISKSKVVIT